MDTMGICPICKEKKISIF